MLFTNYNLFTSTFKQRKVSLLHSKTLLIALKRNMHTGHVLPMDPRFFETPYNPLIRCRDLVEANNPTAAANLLRRLDDFLFEATVHRHLDVNNIILSARVHNWLISPTVIDLYKDKQVTDI